VALAHAERLSVDRVGNRTAQASTGYLDIRHIRLRAMIETAAASLPAHKRQKFLKELLAFMQPN
jgi:hypothetical protein